MPRQTIHGIARLDPIQWVEIIVPVNSARRSLGVGLSYTVRSDHNSGLIIAALPGENGPFAREDAHISWEDILANTRLLDPDGGVIDAAPYAARAGCQNHIIRAQERIRTRILGQATFVAGTPNSDGLVPVQMMVSREVAAQMVSGHVSISMSARAAVPRPMEPGAPSMSVRAGGRKRAKEEVDSTPEVRKAAWEHLIKKKPAPV